MTHPRPSRVRTRAHLCTLAPLLAAALLAACAPESAQQSAPPIPAVGVVEVAEEQINPFFEFVGKTRAVETVALRARVTGFLEERAFQEGGVVEAGQVLFRIEPDQYQATLAQAEAEKAAAEASLKRAEVDLARFQELAKANNVSQQKVDEAQAEVLVQRAAVTTAEANIQKAQLDVGYTEIKAPVAGRIDLAAFDVGNLIGPDSGVLATINRMDPINVAFSIAETWYLDLVRADLAAKRERGDQDTQAQGRGDASRDFSHVPRIRLPDGSLYEHDGSFDFVDNKVDEKTGTVLIRARFPNPDRALLPGQFVKVLVERAEPVGAVMVPQAAVLTDQGGQYVLLVDDHNRVESRRIQPGQRFGTALEVRDGLTAGERIVLHGIQKVRPGIAVDPQPTEATRDPLADVAAGPASNGEDARAAEGSPSGKAGDD